MTPTWQRIIKAGKGILEIARVRTGLDKIHTINDCVTVSSLQGWVNYADIRDDVMLYFDTEDVLRDVQINAEALNHLEEIAQAFEEALEIWRKM